MILNFFNFFCVTNKGYTTCSIVTKRNFPELVTIIKPKIMKTRTLNFDKTRNMFTEFALSTKEMINVRGGSGEHDELLPEPIVKPCNPPIKI